MTNPTWKRERDSSKRWWNKNRLKYNLGLIISGFLALILYIIVIEFLILKSDKNWDGEITIFNILFQAFGYLIMIGIANILYYLGPITEKLINPIDKNKYRKIAFNLGFWLSCFLPFLVPLILIINYLM